MDRPIHFDACPVHSTTRRSNGPCLADGSKHLYILLRLIFGIGPLLPMEFDLECGVLREELGLKVQFFYICFFSSLGQQPPPHPQHFYLEIEQHSPPEFDLDLFSLVPKSEHWEIREKKQSVSDWPHSVPRALG